MKTKQSLVYIVLISLFYSFSNAQTNRYTIPTELLVLPQKSFAIQEFYLNDVQVEEVSKSMNIFLLRCTSSNRAQELLAKYKNDKRIIAIQYNHQFDYRSYTPIDSYYTNQWYLNNTGQYGYTAGVDIDAPLAWDSSTTNITKYGDTLVVAIADVKFDLNHRDINYFKNYDEIPLNGIDDDANGYIDDYNGWNALLNNDDVNLSTSAHATQLAGIVGAKHDNKGIAGICNGVKILPIYTQAIESQAIEAYAYIVDMRKMYDQTGGTKGAYIVSSNTSFGIDNAFAIDFPIWCAMYDSMGKYGILSAAATANRYQDVDVVGDIPTTCLSNFMISTTNITGTNTLSTSAAYGSSSIDLAAPGINIFSCIGSDAYAGGNGTSYASPQIAGAVAYLMSYACPKFLDLYASFPDSAMLLLKKYILDGSVAVPDLTGKTVTGGRLNLYQSILELNTQFDCTDCHGNISIIKNDVVCNSDSTGSIQITIQPTNATLTYNWSNGSNTALNNHLAAGNYRVTITDSIGCQRIKTITILEPSELNFDSLKISAANDLTSGSIYVRGAGATAPYTFSIDGSNYYNTNLFLGLNAGNYTVYIKDQNGCIISQNVTVENHTGIEINKNLFHIDLLNTITDNFISCEIAASDETFIYYEIYDISGREVIPNNKLDLNNHNTLHKIDLSSLSNGIYLLTFKNQESTINSYKIVKY